MDTLSPDSLQINEADIPSKVEQNRPKYLNRILVGLSVLIILCLVVSGLILRYTQPKHNMSYGIPPSPTTIANITPTKEIKRPEYDKNTFLHFTHFNQGYSIDYPANTLLRLTGATSGNLITTVIDNGKTNEILIYTVYGTNNKNLTLNNITDLNERGEGGEVRFFPQDQSFINKEEVLINGKKTYLLKTAGDGSSNRDIYIIPTMTDKVYVIEYSYNEKSALVEKMLQSFTTLPATPPSWKESKLSNSLAIHIPPDFTTEVATISSTEKEISLHSSQDKITFFISSNSPRYQGSLRDYRELLDAVLADEQARGYNNENTLYEMVAFTFIQGGNKGVRAIHKNTQTVDIYFNNEYGDVRVEAPKSMEDILNQILSTINYQ